MTPYLRNPSFHPLPAMAGRGWCRATPGSRRRGEAPICV